MFDHVKFGVRDYERSKAFYLAVLEPLGMVAGPEGTPSEGIELILRADASLCLYQSDEEPAHLHIAFVAQSREEVQAFHRAALTAGGRDNGLPGRRPQYQGNYYAAFVIDPDGHNVEAVWHE